MKKTGYSRREFLEVSTAAAGASLAAKTIVGLPHDVMLAPRAGAASDRRSQLGTARFRRIIRAPCPMRQAF